MLDEYIKYIRNISWDEVFETWYQREGARDEWQEFAIDTKGWPDWKSWRKASADFIGADKREWKLYEITNPNEFIPECIIGPWQKWQNNFKEKNKHTFEDLVAMCPDWVSANGKIQAIKKDFPIDTQFIGIWFKESDRFIIFEGSHRAAAIAQAKAERSPIDFKNNPTIAVCEFSDAEAELLRRKLERGTNMHPNKH